MKSESESEVAQCPTLCDPMDCSLSSSSVHGIFQARVLEWIAISFSKGSSLPRNRTQISSIAGIRFYRLSHQGSHFFFKKKNFKCILSVNIYFRHQFKKKIRNENQWSLSTIWDTLKIQIITNVLNYTIHCSLSIADVYISI